METAPGQQGPDDIRKFIEQEAARQHAQARDHSDRISRAKNAMWLLLLVVVFLEYYLILTLIEANSVKDLGIRLPVHFQQNGCPASNSEHRPAMPPRHVQAADLSRPEILRG